MKRRKRKGENVNEKEEKGKIKEKWQKKGFVEGTKIRAKRVRKA